MTEDRPTIPMLVVAERFNLDWWLKHRPGSGFVARVKAGTSSISSVDDPMYVSALLRFGALHSRSPRDKLRRIGVDLDQVDTVAMNMLPPASCSDWDRNLAIDAATRISEELLSPLRFGYRPDDFPERSDRVLSVLFCGRRVASAFGISQNRALGSLFDLRFRVDHDVRRDDSPVTTREAPDAARPWRSRYEVWDWGTTDDSDHGRLVLGMVVPHPSGLSRWWNDAGGVPEVLEGTQTLTQRRRRIWGE